MSLTGFGRHDLLPRGMPWRYPDDARCPLNCNFCSVTTFNGLNTGNDRLLMSCVNFVHPEKGSWCG